MLGRRLAPVACIALMVATTACTVQINGPITGVFRSDDADGTSGRASQLGSADSFSGLLAAESVSSPAPSASTSVEPSPSPDPTPTPFARSVSIDYSDTRFHVVYEYGNVSIMPRRLTATVQLSNGATASAAIWASSDEGLLLVDRLSGALARGPRVSMDPVVITATSPDGLASASITLQYGGSIDLGT